MITENKIVNSFDILREVAVILNKVAVILSKAKNLHTKYNSTFRDSSLTLRMTKTPRCHISPSFLPVLTADRFHFVQNTNKSANQWIISK